MNILGNIEFLNPEYFLLFFLIPFIVYFFYKKQSKIPFVFMYDIRQVYGKNSVFAYAKMFSLVLVLIGFVLIGANPNSVHSQKDVSKNGIDIVIAFDVSGSMEASDLSPSRMEAAKTVIQKFIEKLKTDRLGLVIFAGKPFTSIPLTFDYNILKENVDKLSTTTINQQKQGLNGTAIGDAILMSKTLFKPPLSVSKQDYEKRQKVIILLTDGDANVGVEPTLAALSAVKENIKIYTIGIGSEKGGTIQIDLGGGFTQEREIPPLNEKTLKEIASHTSGEFFRATDNKTLSNVFETLSKLDKNDIKINVTKLYDEYYTYFMIFLLLSLFFFCIFIFKDVDYASHQP